MLVLSSAYLLDSCMFVPMLITIEGTQFESCEGEELREQELKTLSSYYLDLRQIYSSIIFCPNNIYFKLACINFDGYLLSLLIIHVLQ